MLAHRLSSRLFCPFFKAKQAKQAQGEGAKLQKSKRGGGLTPCFLMGYIELTLHENDFKTTKSFQKQNLIAPDPIAIWHMAAYRSRRQFQMRKTWMRRAAADRTARTIGSATNPFALVGRRAGAALAIAAHESTRSAPGSLSPFPTARNPGSASKAFCGTLPATLENDFTTAGLKIRSQGLATLLLAVEKACGLPVWIIENCIARRMEKR